ncbi:PD-(D/E)XK motif protein [Euryarchaeota archaeon]|nr:PD-(D/E)XK motif protein [Euryarchaeota archaeon]
MNEREYNLSEEIYSKKGNIIIAEYEYEIEYFIPGEYELKIPIVNEISKLVELNDKIHTRITIPNQDEIMNLLSKTIEIIEKDNWFSDKNKHQLEFSTFERVLAKSLTKFNLDQNTKIGLIGELHLLKSILSIKSDIEKHKEIINGWFGYISKSRDFIYGNTCIEVKTTTKSQSIHHISNLNQVDPVDDDGGITDLYLASIGISKEDEGMSIPSLVESIISLLSDDALKSIIIDNISNFGYHNIGYNHHRMKDWSQFQNKYDISFERYYNMSDSNIKILRHSDINGMTSVIGKTITYQIELGAEIFGSENNPISSQELIEIIFN